MLNELVNLSLRLMDVSNKGMGLITLVVGFVAIYLYLKQKKDHKRDAALLILQEVRYAEQSVRNYRTNKTYTFTEKILPTSSWHKNIHLFVKDLKETDIDLISKFYSNAAYLDGVIGILADFSTKELLTPETPVDIKDEEGHATRIATSDMGSGLKALVNALSENVEFIYNTPAMTKLRLLSERKWYMPF